MQPNEEGFSTRDPSLNDISYMLSSLKFRTYSRSLLQVVNGCFEAVGTVAVTVQLGQLHRVHGGAGAAVRKTAPSRPNRSKTTGVVIASFPPVLPQSGHSPSWTVTVVSWPTGRSAVEHEERRLRGEKRGVQT